MSVKLDLTRYLTPVEDELRDALAATETLYPFYGMMQYHMGWLDEHLEPVDAPRGKRLRPVLCMLACESVGGSIERSLPAAAAIELLHNFSLIHDDIEDVSEKRRHRTTVWTLWGMAHGINCGDGMFAKAFLELGRLSERGVPSEQVLRAQRILVETCQTLTEGQYLDMSFENRMDVSLEEYLYMIGGKSAALIACSARLGALLGGADRETIAAYAHFGENLGMAFQVVDDILGIWGDEIQTGKSTSTDILTCKKTLPVVYALQDEELRAMYTPEAMSEERVGHVIAILERKRAREFAEQTAREYSERAMRSLEQVRVETPAWHTIRELAFLLLERTF